MLRNRSCRSTTSDPLIYLGFVHTFTEARTRRAFLEGFVSAAATSISEFFSLLFMDQSLHAFYADSLSTPQLVWA